MAGSLPPLNLDVQQKLSNQLQQTFSTGGVNISLPPKPAPAPTTQGLTGFLTPTNMLVAAVVLIGGYVLLRKR